MAHSHSHGHHNPYYAARDLYAAYWVPFLFWLGERTFDGREHAGKAAHRSRLVRLGVTAIRLLAMQMMVQSMDMSYRTFLKEGAEVPLWFGEETPTEAGVWAWVAMGCMAINMLAILYGSAANHHKIQQYYDRQIVLQEDANAKHGKTDPVPHGWHAPRPIFWVNAARYVHDANGLTGSVLSSIILMSVVADMLGSSLGIENATLGKLFFASNVMALLSVVCVPLTTKARLWAHQKVMVPEMQKQSAEASQDIQDALAKLFGSIKESPEKTALYYHAVRACEYVKAQPGCKLNVALMSFVIDQYVVNSAVSITRIKQHGPWLDALDLIETQMIAALTNRSVEFIQAKLPEKLLKAKMDSRGITGLPKDVTQTTDGKLQINQPAVAHDYPVSSNPHGEDQFVPAFHTERMLRS